MNPVTLQLANGTATLRRASIDDVRAIVEMLVEDPLGATRDAVDGPAGLEPYRRAFETIDSDPAHLLLVVESSREVIATMQLSFLPGLARRGALRAQIEAVRVRADQRGSGLGRAMMVWAIDDARRRGCALVQLTSDKQRADAHRFYVQLGFAASHEGFKLSL